MTKKNILITGCSSGIGLACVKQLLDRGENVFATARKPEDLDKLKALGATAIHMELSNEDSIQACMKQVIEQGDGKIDVLINNAGAAVPGAVEDLSTSALHRQFQINVFGTMELTRLVIPYMRDQRRGRIIFVSSILAILTMQCRGAYSASKHALESFVRAMRMELKDTPIKVISFRPGAIRTEFRANAKQAFAEHVDSKDSHHKDLYKRYNRQDFDKLHKPLPFSLTAEKAAEKIVKVVYLDKPKPMYYVTFAAHLMSWLSRCLPERCIDWIMQRF
ncbi:MAG: SDR family NAD(P)-dependent oxidoreductase [Coxiellaceae bacterium]|nr:SDR family NAD(P)-dependent oxidoreductase [Coxiellaceae bacterium]